MLLLVATFFLCVDVLRASESARCFLNCLSGKPLNDTGFRDMVAPRHLVRRSVDEDGPCGVPTMFIGCINNCPKDRASDVVLPMLQHFSEKYCTRGSNETALQQFIMDSREFSEKLSEQLVRNACFPVDYSRPFDIAQMCKMWSECNFGKALNAVKDNFSEEVVAFSVDTAKFGNAVFVEAISDDELPQACNTLFEPYKRDGRQPKDA